MYQFKDSQFSVLISVYYKEKAGHLQVALESIINQSVVPAEIVLVKDGKLGQELDRVIAEFAGSYPELFKIIEFEKNRGLSEALRVGIVHCQHEIIARMDSDDISRFDRFEKQLRILQENPDIDLVGSWVDEFIGTGDNVISQRKVPESSEEIMRYARSRNPLNHPTVMFRKRSVIEAGSYQEMLLSEDYYLWVRMLMKGSRMYNIQESLLYFRTGRDTFRRRGGVKYFSAEFKLQRWLLKERFINYFEFLRNVLVRSTTRLMPNSLRQVLYLNFLRNRHREKN